MAPASRIYSGLSSTTANPAHACPAVALFAGKYVYHGPLLPSTAQLTGFKTFLVFKDEAGPSWSETLRDARGQYADARDHLLTFIKHPEALAKLTIDPLADDPDVSSGMRRWRFNADHL